MLGQSSCGVGTIALVLLLVSAASAQDDPAPQQNTHPFLMAEAGDEILVGTLPIPGYGASGLIRLRGPLDDPEVLRPHDPSVVVGFVPSVWFAVAGDGALIGTDEGRLWRLDPTGPERTIVDLDLAQRTSVTPVGQARGIVYFGADTGALGWELWRTDGSADGTRLLTELAPGTASSWPSGGVTVGSVVFFSAATPEHGRELWRTDGTEEGTVLVADLWPGSESSAPALLGRIGNELVLGGTSALGEQTLWITDGSRAGTRVLLADAPTVYPNGRVAAVGDVLTFQALDAAGFGYCVWRTDGTTAGTYRLSPGGPSSGLVAAAGGVWFGVGGDPEVRGLWMSDGSLEGSRRVWTLPGTAPEIGVVDSVGLGPEVGDWLVFRAHWNAEGASLWRTDGSAEGTVQLVSQSDGVRVEVGSSMPNTYYFGMLAATRGAAWFAAGTATGSDLWVTDGTLEGTRPAPLAGLSEATEFPTPQPLAAFADGGPVGPEPAPATVEPDPPVEPPPALIVDDLRVKQRPQTTDLSVRCRVPLSGGTALTGESVVIDVGGVRAEVDLNRRGRGKTDAGWRVTTRILRRRGASTRELRLTLRIERADLGTALDDEDLSLPPDGGASTVDRPIAVTVTWRGAEHAATPTLRYHERRGKGIARLLD